MGHLEEDLNNALSDLYDMELVRNLGEFLKGEVAVLVMLQRGADTPTALAERLNVTKPRVSMILTGLRKKGYVTLSMSAEDRRSTVVAPTEAGLRYVDGKQARVRACIAGLTAGLGEADSRRLIGLIEKCVKILRGAIS